MSQLVPSWAFSGQAVDAAGDAHLSPGVHFRLLTNPLLGLPLVPIAVGRADLHDRLEKYTRHDVTWVDSHGAVLTTPFTVSPDNPVTAHLPLGRTCCWAAVDAQADSVLAPFLPTRPPLLVAHRERVLPMLDVRKHIRPLDVVLKRPPVKLPGDIRLIDRLRQAPLRVEGLVATPLGDAPVAIRSRAPYHVYASHVERVVVRGSGTVTGISWLPAGSVDGIEPFRMLPLPTGPGARYAGPPDGRDQAMERVHRGAPQRFGMHESPLATSPSACAAAGPSDEEQRVEDLALDAEKSLDLLLNDTSAPQQHLSAVEEVVDEMGVSLGSSDRLLLMDLLQGAVDPGFARWLGLLDVDQEPPDQGVVVAYVVDALFAPDWKTIQELGLEQTLPQDALVEDVGKAAALLQQSAPDLEKYVEHLKEMAEGPFLLGRVVLAATVGVPLDQPARPDMDPPLSGDWLPAPPPTALREMTARLQALVPAAGLASAIAQPVGATPVERNPKDRTGRRRLLTPRPDPTATGATQGVLNDRRVDERDGTWQTAQMDWFGRWSSWSSEKFLPGQRPRPPRPVFTLTTRPPTIATPGFTGPLAGSVRVEVSVPPARSLPAGGRLLDHLELRVSTGVGAPAVSTHPLPTSGTPPEVLVVQVPGPTLLPTQVGTVTVTAVWTDGGGVDSDVSEPKHATLHDPRPPAPVTIPPTLEYTARPDATGRARATLTWVPATGQAGFRVFVADETTLRAKLEDIVAGRLAPGDAGQAPSAAAAQSVLTQLDAAEDAPARGAVWNANRSLLPRRWWRQLTAEPIPSGSSPVTFHHDVSGSLGVLALYRVVAVSAASVESAFRTSPLLPRGVPNLLPPPAPTLEVLPVTDDDGDLLAQLTVTVPVGPTPAARYRIRRATATTDPAFMPVVAEGPVPPRTATAPQVFTVIDTGATPSGPRESLAPWLRYHWRVEVQGAAAPGGGPTGEWSSPSAPVSTITMPPEPPAPVSGLTLVRDVEGVHVRFTHPDPLAGGGTAGYTLDVYRQLAGQPLRHLHSLPGQAPPPRGRGTNPAASFHIIDNEAGAVAGTVYQVVVTDPIGRASTPSPPQEAP